ncbi:MULTISPECIES: ferric reductase [Winogradskyella]|uniref:Sulfoxide reductase heme-binding subunit YedZ n=3 Tax=Winogradskyella TaxID=286104 RepID=A0A3D9MZS6_9FLAO|nr:ferric reductase [Winogradskyella pacifica]REE25865.1 sulfoxide reductase heme-binding subunit YedZ [Winogradskyella pacifica]
MKYIKKNYGWMIITILAILPMIPLLNMVLEGGKENLDMLYHISGEFAIRWMTAVLTCTPFFILFGINNLFVRQAMGIATAVWSFLHFIIFIVAEGFMETFTQVNYIAGFIAVLILIPLFFTSNRKSMKRLKVKWKKLQSFAYAAIFLSLLHVAILEKTWLIYAIIVGVGFIIRLPIIKDQFISRRQNRKSTN